MDFQPHNQLPGDDQAESGETREIRYGSRWWAFPLLLVGVIVLAVAAKLIGEPLAVRRVESQGPSRTWTPTPMPDGETVALTIDFGNGASRVFAALPWEEGATVRDVMIAAGGLRPSIRFEQQGEGAAALLTSLEGVANEGAGGRNWLYQVDDQHGVVSFAVRTLKPGQRVLWTFRRGE